MGIFVNLEVTVLFKISLHKENLSKQNYLLRISIYYIQKIVYDLLPKTGVFHQFHLFSTKTIAELQG